MPENAFLEPFFDVIHILIKHSDLLGTGKVLLKISLLGSVHPLAKKLY